MSAIFEVSQGIATRDPTRPVIVATVAEGQELSYRFYEQVLDQLGKSRARLYVLMLGSPYIGSNEEAQSRESVISLGLTSYPRSGENV
jgi:hypothetical protein